MLRKYATLAVLDAWRVAGSAKGIRKAAHRVTFDYTPRPGYLYVRARAISSRTNDNYDTFEAEEIEKGYKTFLGKPAFINHHNANHRRARGVIVAAALHRDKNADGSPDVWVELLHELDAVRFPKLAKGILSGRINRTSMGVDCEYSTCSACGNKATNPSEYCAHMPARKGMKFRKRGADGKIREGVIHEICAGLTFFENSFLVEDPADPSAVILDKPHLHPVTASKAAQAPGLLRHFAAMPFGGQPLYHGTRSILHPGEMLTVDQAREHANNADIQTDPYVHATPDAEEAHRWGERANSSAASARMHEMGRQQRQGPGENEDRAYPPRVYHVEPTGPVEPDNEYEDTEPNSYRSAHPMRVTHEVHPLTCWHEDHEGAEHWPGHPHYQFLKDEQDEQDDDDEGSSHYGAARPTVPFTVAPEHPLPRDFLDAYDNGREDSLPQSVRRIPIAKIKWGHQSTLDPGIMQEYRSGARQGDFLPEALAVGGHYHLNDGHHRVQAGHDNGKKTIKSTVFHEPPGGWDYEHEPPGHEKTAATYTPDPDGSDWVESRDVNALEQMGKDSPHGAAIQIAQQRTAFDHPNMHTQLPDPVSEGSHIFSETGGKVLKHMLTAGGYRGSAEGAFVARHRNPGGATSNPAMDRQGNPGVALHPDRWDYGTLAHEAAHHIANGPERFNDSSMNDEEIHGPGYAHAYSKTLSLVSKGAGEDFLRHHGDARREVSDYRVRVHGLPRIDGQHEASLTQHFATQPYSMQHQGPDPGEGEGLHEIGSGKIYPKNFHQRPSDYYQGADEESIDKVHGSRDWPGRKVWAYRALPSPHREVNTGDWVSTSKNYARSEGRTSRSSDDDYPVVKFQARAEHLRNEGNSLDEWSYTGPKVNRALVHFSGGKNHRGKGPRGGKTDAMCFEHEPDEMYQRYEQANRERREKRKAERAAREAGMQHEAAPRYADPADHPWFKEHPVHKDNIKAAWADSTDGEKEQGKRWYPDASLVAGAIAHGDKAMGAGLLAAYSPRTNWPANMFNAARSVHEGRAMGSRKGDGAIMGMHWHPAERILNGEHHSQVLKGPKTRAFATLIEHGGQHPDDIASGTAHVVVDRHAMSVAAGHRLTDKEAVSAPIDKPHYYHHIEQKYLGAADEISAESGSRVTPEHVQATTWLRQVRRNTEEDNSVKNQFGGGGRQTRNRNDLAKWTDYAREHHPSMTGDTMHTGALQMLAGDPPLRVPPSVDTLRPEACPVCGDQDVFKGQRCPICGFVAPPDIFRDPDIDKAKEMRQQLEQGKQENPLPEGPADEEQIGSGQDADDQMFHPDQIAPDGVPGVQGDPTAPGQGMLDQSGDQELDENGEPLDPDEVEDPDADPEGAAVEEDADAQEEEAMAEQMGAQAEGDEEGAEEDEEAAEGGSPGKDQDDEDDDERPGGKKMAKQQHTAELAAITAQQRVVDALRRENASLRAGLSFIAELAGVTPEIQRILKQADEMNPAQPVPDPPEAPPTSTTEQALMTGAPTGSGSGTARGPGHTMDDPSRPGITPGSLTAVPAEQTTTALTPGVEMQTPPAGQLVDVTAPVQGTNPSQDGGVPLEQRRIETDVRINPNPLAAQGPGIGGQGNDGTAFPWTLPAREGLRATASLTPEDERGARTFASIRLARLRVQAGLARGDELELGTHIERQANLTLRDIEREIETLGRVTKAASAAQAQPRYPRGITPKTAARAAPSFSGEPVPAMAMTAGVTGYDNDDFDVFL